jgi:3-oxoacyl-(acyl-carrier-protein) synthase/acyl carrier protein/SAM-dependent methyltransferase
MANTIAALEAELPTAEMTGLVTEILAASLTSLGLFSDGIQTIAALAPAKPPAPYYERWLSSSILYLQQQNVLAEDLTPAREIRTLADLWAEWDVQLAVWASSPNLRTQGALLEACLKALPAIVSGKQRATDVMFPNSSMELVEGIYRGNVVADHFNDLLGETLTAGIEELLQADPERRIRILEIGAGTGGTTAKLLPILQRYPIEEYCYSDISRMFLMFAEKELKPQFAALTTAIFDVSKPLASQSIAAGQYDFAIAANVLHATPDIRETVRNAKAALKNEGVLLLNEISMWSLFNHLTFGLLEGWWLTEDTPLRMAGCPGLAPGKWQEILAQEGFERIRFPATETHQFGQQIVAACSDGWVRQRTTAKAPPASPATTSPRKEVQPSRAAEPTEQMGHDYVRQVIVEKLSEGLRMDPSRIRTDSPFAEYGVDSIIGVNLVRTINETLEIELETITLFDFTTVDQLVEHIWSTWHPKIAGQPDQAPSVSREPISIEAAPAARESAGVSQRFIDNDSFDEDARGTRSGRQPEGTAASIGVEPIAVIGMSGRFAESESLDEFWQHLEQGKTLIGQISRWSASDCVMSETEGQTYCSYGSFIDSIDRFDPSFFRISPSEARYMDPQQRLFLEECWKALEDAGYAGKGVQETQCGVYVGCAGATNYPSFFVEEPPAHAFWGNSDSIIPARIAYCLDLQGPAIAVDTACSSSLVTIHLACQGLWSRETDMALAGGVCLHSTPGFYQVANRARMLSPNGTCYSFDARANGFVPGEGVGVVVLKRLRDALRDGDNIHGVIAGSGINQDGASNGLIAPNARAQERLERSVYDRFRIDPATIQLVEAHGTGTSLGDSIEYGAISRSFRQYTDKKQFCAIGTVKTNIGHTGGAAGVAGVLKLLLSLKNRQIPPSLNFEKGNPAIDFESSPFYVNTGLKEWTVEGGQRRRGAVSSFGFSGTNAHLIIDEAPPMERPAIQAPGYLVVLSGRTSEQLNEQVHNLIAWARRSPGLSMSDLSFSLFVGRMHFNHRLSCVARTAEELIRQLAQWTETGAASQVYASQIAEGRVREQAALKRFGNYCIRECGSALDAATYLENLAAIADLYAQGYSLDYQDLFPRGAGRIPLPTYPFARERYWADAARSAEPKPAARTAPHQGAARAAASRRPAPSAELTDQVIGDYIRQVINEKVAEVLKLDVAEIGSDAQFRNYGVDSLSGVMFVRAINDALEIEVEPSTLLECSTIDELTEYILAQWRTRISAQLARSPGASQEPHSTTIAGDPVDAGQEGDSCAIGADPIAVADTPADSRLRATASDAPRPASEEDADVTPPESEMNSEQVLASVLWPPASPLDDGYEKVTF